MLDTVTGARDNEAMDFVDISPPTDGPQIASTDHKGKTPWIDEDAPGAKLAWLYGREPEATEYGDMQIIDDAGLVVEYRPGIVRPGGMGGADFGDLTSDEAVEFARALLAAAESARKG